MTSVPVAVRLHNHSLSVVSLIAYKTRVAPLKEQTIPRLELLAAGLLARLITTVQGCLKGASGFSLLYRFGDSTALDLWPGQNMEALCPKQSTGDKASSAHEKLETLWRMGNPGGPSLSRTYLAGTDSKFIMAARTELARRTGTSRGTRRCASYRMSGGTYRLTVLLTTAGIGVSNIVEISRYGNRDKLLRVTQLVVKLVRGLQ